MYVSGDLSFEEAERAINILWTLIIVDNEKKISSFELSESMISIHEAFDNGEYGHGDNADPVGKFTK